MTVSQVDVHTYDRMCTNETNRLFRHCRIGKVTRKLPTKMGELFQDFPKGQPLPPYKDAFTFQWPVIYKDQRVPAMCRQCIGKACGNAACPSRLGVTCLTGAENSSIFDNVEGLYEM